MTAIQICQQCHARVAEPTSSECPACRRILIPVPESHNPQVATGATDHRGIILPPRHAVGGIITPR